MEFRDWAILIGFGLQLAAYLFTLGRMFQRMDTIHKDVVVLKKGYANDHQTVVSLATTHNINHPGTRIDIPAAQTNGNGGA
jgi:hypothetical protein